MSLFLAVENVIPADHPAAILAIPLGILFFCGSVYVLLWSSYGAKKAGAIYGTAFFGFSFLLGVFFWLGGPGIPPSLGITHLPGQTSSEYNPTWYGFEQGSERAAHFAATNDPDSFQTVIEFLGKENLSRERLRSDPLYASVVGDVDASVGVMQEQYLPITASGLAVMGSQVRAQLEADVAELQETVPELQDASRAAPFYTSERVGPTRITEDPATGLRVVTQRFQTVANFIDADGVPVLQEIPDARPELGEATEGPWPVGGETDWFAFQDPGARWFPSVLWTLISLFGFGLSLFWLDRLEAADKRRQLADAEEPEDLAVPIAQ